METHAEDDRAARLAARAALGTLIGLGGSGPLALLAIEALRPQPLWRSPDVFAREFHDLHVLPYVFGFVLVGSYALLIASLHALARAAHRPRTTAALVCTAAYAALVTLNYAAQTTFIPPLARNYDAALAPILTALSMANPGSLAWALELWGYAWLGLATWLVAPVLAGPNRSARIAKTTFEWNGPASVGAAAWAIADSTWPMSTAGLIAYVIWNVLAVVMSASAYLALRSRGIPTRESDQPMTSIHAAMHPREKAS